MRPIMFLSALLATLAFAEGAAAVGPSLPAVDNVGITTSTGNVTYVAHLVGTSTRVQAKASGRTTRTGTLAGRWGIQLATLNGALSGLSPNGRTLVLSDNVRANGNLRARSRFVVIDTRTLSITKRIVLRGDFSVDALSPKGDTLYLIHHVSNKDATKYRVRAYDLATGQLLPGVIADKSQAGWTMAGYPVNRATSASGRWVYTLYQQNTNYPFIHALDTVDHRAVCIELPTNLKADQAWISSARLALTSGKLAITTNSGITRFILDTHTFHLATP